MKLARFPVFGAMLFAVLFIAPNGLVRGQEKDPEKAPAAQPIAKGIVGYWQLDRGQMLKVMLERAAKDAGGQALDQPSKDMIAEMVNQIVAGMVLELTEDGISRVHSAEREDHATYKMLKAEEETGEFSLEVTPAEGEIDLVAGKIEGDLLSMTSDEMELHFIRLKDEQAKARLAALKKKAEEGDGQEEE